MQLSELGISLTQMDRKDALALILEVRRSRRTVKRKVAVKRKAKPKATPVQTLIKGLGEQDISALINLIEEQQGK